jgi:hypothetical protein
VEKYVAILAESRADVVAPKKVAVKAEDGVRRAVLKS